MTALTIAVAALAAGSAVFCILAVIAARSYLKQPAGGPATPPLSVLKPLHGLDEGLEENLRSFFEQDYEDYELLFAAREHDDPGLALARRLSSEYPSRRARFLAVGEPPYANAKVFSLDKMTAGAAHDVLVMADSDIRAPRNLLRILAGEFSDPALGVATCPYRAVAGRSVWSRLEAVGMNTEFWGGVFTARLVEGGVKFAVGPTSAARKQAIEAAGGWTRLSEYLAEDFVLGQFAATAGWKVILSNAIVEHRIGSQPLAANFKHRLRWNRSTRRSRPAGYTGQIFTYPLVAALALAAVRPEWSIAATALVALRVWTAWTVGYVVLREPSIRTRWDLLLAQDLLSFVFWVAGFFGSTIEWRGESYRVLKDGRLTRA